MKNRIEDLRNHLFATLEALQDDEKPMDIARAKAVSDVSQTIINTAKLEIKYLEVTGQKSGTDFLPPEGGRPQLPPARK
ncbi:hypothetical protein [Salinicola sp. CPA57]|uniref:hypothetical protein n=1 Tax=Salinicola sp. CPA57 TaxID=1949080 RepID=UPI000DA1C1F0|nr:hypothetical protein [Salinicola sp. CPA57]